MRVLFVVCGVLWLLAIVLFQYCLISCNCDLVGPVWHFDHLVGEKTAGNFALRCFVVDVCVIV